ncbi:hypothetical protein CQW23_28413 [Capsicum baccatum]|uniref:Uncharacterized protein n=1 Tax=Capsicum baccatum TaxID=33114 RepID=A0A2G2VGH1_CAPBA|nr:hypothetical protein CQW23_28413 [Capsicum baccatum]
MIILTFGQQLEGGISHLPLLDPLMRAAPLAPSEWRKKLEAVNNTNKSSHEKFNPSCILLDVRNAMWPTLDAAHSSFTMLKESHQTLITKVAAKIMVGIVVERGCVVNMVTRSCDVVVTVTEKSCDAVQIVTGNRCPVTRVVTGDRHSVSKEFLGISLCHYNHIYIILEV